MKKIILTIFSGFLFFSLTAQDVLTLEKAMEIAIENNFNIKVANNNAQISKNSATAANAGLLPRVDLSSGVNYSNNNIKSEMGDIEQEFTQTNAGVSLSYTIFDGLNNVNSFKKLKLMAESGELQSISNIENILLQVISSFYQTANSYENLQISTEMFEISKERIERSKTKREFGNVSGLEFLNAQVDFNNDSINYIKALNSFNESKRNLNVQLGRTPNSKFTITSNTDNFNVFAIDDLKSGARDNNASYLLANNKVLESQYDIKSTNASFMPNLNLQSSYGYNQQLDNFAIAMDNPNMNFTTGVSLSFNIFDGGIKSTRKQNAKIYLENTQLQLQEKELVIDKEIENSYSNYNNNLLVMKTEEINLQSAELNFNQTKEYYILGQVTSTQFREAQLNLSRAKMNINIARFSAKLSEIQLIYLSGNLLSAE